MITVNDSKIRDVDFAFHSSYFCTVDSVHSFDPDSGHSVGSPGRRPVGPD